MCAAAVLIYASYSLTDSYLNYKEDEAKYAEINKNVHTEDLENKKTKKRKIKVNILHLLQHGFGITKQCCSTTMKQEVTLN